ncbi:MAG: acyltransferase family protein [Butyrivibrio sp.]|nr:acyltransferase family protein [Butyrivibrio sp.]
MQKKERVYSIDLLESIAMLFVIAYHGTNYGFEFLDDSRNVFYYLSYFFRSIVSCATPLFFFANGYLLLNREFNLKKHIRKCIKLVIITAVWAVIYMFMIMNFKHEILSPKEFLWGIWTWKQDWINFLWFIPSLIVIYIFLPLIKTAFDHNREAFYFFTIITAILTFGNVFLNICCSIASNVVLGTNEIYHTNWFNNYNPFRNIYGYTIVHFCVGGIAPELKKKIRFLDRPRNTIFVILLSMLGLTVTGVVLSRIQNDYWDVVWNGTETVFTLINVFCIYSLCTEYKGKENWFRKIICAISVNTLGIYFLHMAVLPFVGAFIYSVDFLYNVPGNLLYGVLTLLATLGLVLVFKKIPLLKELVQ